MSLKRNTIYNILINISNVLFPIITTPYISRVLGVENIGLINFSVAYAAYFMMFAMLGVPTYGMRIIAQHTHSLRNRSQIFCELTLILTSFSAIVSLIYICTIYTIPFLYDQRQFLLIIGLTVLFAPLNIEWYFSGREKFSLIAIRSILIKLLMVIGMFIFVQTKEDVLRYMYLLVGSMLLNQILNWFYLLNNEIDFHIKWNFLFFRRHFKPLLMLFSSTLAISVYTMLDTLMLGFLSSYEEVGYYTSAMKISRLVMPIVVAMSPIVFVRVSTLKDRGDLEAIKSLLQQSFSYMYVLAVPITIGLIVIAPKFVPFFFGVEFTPAVFLMQLLSILIIIVGVGNVYGSQLIQSMGYDKKYLSAVITGTVSNFVLNFIFIPYFGSVGAAVSSIVAEFLVTSLMVIFSFKIMKLLYTVKEILGPIISCIPIFLFSSIALKLGFNELEYLIFVIPISVVTYLLIMYFFIKHSVVVKNINSFASKLYK